MRGVVSGSLPTRERGLKLAHRAQPPAFRVSLPTRERGLKPVLFDEIHQLKNVAPHAGAWIETKSVASAPHSSLVAPHAGAWIETDGNRRIAKDRIVAPHAGAWIETGG